MSSVSTGQVKSLFLFSSIDIIHITHCFCIQTLERERELFIGKKEVRSELGIYFN